MSTTATPPLPVACFPSKPRAPPSSPPACAHGECIYFGDLGRARSTCEATVQCSIGRIKSGRHSDSANASCVTTASLAVTAPYAQHSRNSHNNGENSPYAFTTTPFRLQRERDGERYDVVVLGVVFLRNYIAKTNYPAGRQNHRAHQLVMSRKKAHPAGLSWKPRSL